MDATSLQLALLLVEKVLRVAGSFLTVLLPVIGVLAAIHLLLDFFMSISFRRIR